MPLLPLVVVSSTNPISTNLLEEQAKLPASQQEEDQIFPLPLSSSHCPRPHGFSDATFPQPGFFDPLEKISSTIEPSDTVAEITLEGGMTEYDEAIYESFSPDKDGYTPKQSPDVDQISAKVQQHLKSQILSEELDLSIEEALPEVKILTEERTDISCSASSRESKVIQQIKTEIFSQEFEEDISCSSPEVKGFPSTPGVLTETVGIEPSSLFGAQEKMEQVMWEASIQQDPSIQEVVREIPPHVQTLVEHDEELFKEASKETKIEDKTTQQVITVKDFVSEPTGEETKISQIITSKTTKTMIKHGSSEISDEDLIEKGETSPQEFEDKQSLSLLMEPSSSVAISKSSSSEETSDRTKTVMELAEDSNIVPSRSFPDYQAIATKSRPMKGQSFDETKKWESKDFKKDTSSSTLSTGDESKPKKSDSDQSNGSRPKKEDKLTVREVESWSSSGETESNFYSFEGSDSGRTPRGTPAASRPTSSEFDVNIFPGSSEYDTCVTSQEASFVTATTSQEGSYSTACSSLSRSSRESAHSVDSESSGNLASLEVSSEASETLVPSAQEMELDLGPEFEEPIPEEEGTPTHAHVKEPYDFEIPESVIRSGIEIPFMKPWDKDPTQEWGWQDSQKKDAGKPTHPKVDAMQVLAQQLAALSREDVSHDELSMSESSATQSEQTWIASGQSCVPPESPAATQAAITPPPPVSSELSLTGDSSPPLYAQLNGPVEVDYVPEYDTTTTPGPDSESVLSAGGDWLGPQPLDEGEESQSTDAKRQGEEGSESIASDQDVWDSQQGPEYTEPEAPESSQDNKEGEASCKTEFSYQIHQSYKYDMGFEREADIQEETLDVTEDILLENQELFPAPGFTTSMQYEHEREFDVGVNYSDLYTHQEVDEECLLDDVDKDTDKRLSPSVASLDDAHSTPSYDTLPHRRFFAKNGEHDDMSVSSLQEFERLEAELASSGSKLSQGSADSSDRLGMPTKSGEHDDVSVNSLNEFEKLEKECLDTDSATKEPAPQLSEIEEGHESQDSEASQCTVKGDEGEDSDNSDDYEKRMTEIDEIIRQAQTNVELFHEDSPQPKDPSQVHFIKKALSSSDSTDSSILDKTPPAKKVQEKRKLPEESESLKDDLKESSPSKRHVIASRSGHSFESIESLPRSSTSTVTQFDVESLKEREAELEDYETFLQESKHLVNGSHDKDIVPADHSDNLLQSSLSQMDTSKSSESEDLLTVKALDIDNSKAGSDCHDSSSSGKEAYKGECMLSSSDSMDPSNSTATHATYQFETDSVMSSSINSTQASGEEGTMVSSTDTLEPEPKISYSHDTMASEETCLAMADERLKNLLSQLPPEEFVEGESISEERSVDESGTVTIKRIVTHKISSEPQVHCKSFSGPDAEEKSKAFVESFSKEPVEAGDTFTEVDSEGNLITVTRTVLVQPTVHTVATVKELTKSSASKEPSPSDPTSEPILASSSSPQPPCGFASSSGASQLTSGSRPLIALCFWKPRAKANSTNVFSCFLSQPWQWRLWVHKPAGAPHALHEPPCADGFSWKHGDDPATDDGFSGTRVVTTTTTVSSDGQEHVVSNVTHLDGSSLKKSMEEVLGQFMADDKQEQ
ncbi:hypothetical protein LAZ67_23000053 [Cordylochernes scorpioides]|uniref:Uncharacterized protein n=1 Tax=Cordylochernes scorpioides TaxID=51811 RepID=A0ABY6LPM8_9ARAC|nr:hypothetical protein LAZ67_23000053 [Cordylochernes scorpioides]